MLPDWCSSKICWIDMVGLQLGKMMSSRGQWLVAKNDLNKKIASITQPWMMCHRNSIPNLYVIHVLLECLCHIWILLSPSHSLKPVFFGLKNPEYPTTLFLFHGARQKTSNVYAMEHNSYQFTWTLVVSISQCTFFSFFFPRFLNFHLST